MSVDDRLRAGGEGPGDGGDAERDAWLRAALRHAPDAQAAPPPALRESILAQARAAARPASPAAGAAPSFTFGQYLVALWDWLARPPVAAGFASVMAATLVGMLWWDRPIDDTLPQAPPFQSAPRAARQPAESMSPAATAAPTAPSALARLPVPKAAPPAPPDAFAQSTGPADAEKARESEKRESSARLADRAAARMADTTPPATVDSLDARGAAREERKDRAAIGGAAKPDAAPRPVPAAPSFAPTPAPALAPAPAAATQPAPAPVPFPAERRRDAANDALQAAPAASPAPAPLSSPAAVLTAPSPPTTSAPAPAPATVQAPERADLAPLTKKTAPARESATSDADHLRQTASPEGPETSVLPMARSLSALSSEGLRWSRALPGGGDADVDAPLRAWLADVQASSRRWERRGEHPLGGARADASTLLLRRDGQPALLLRLDDSGVFFESAGGDAWFAPLAPEALARLRAALPRASR